MSFNSRTRSCSRSTSKIPPQLRQSLTKRLELITIIIVHDGLLTNSFARKGIVHDMMAMGIGSCLVMRQPEDPRVWSVYRRDKRGSVMIRPALDKADRVYPSILGDLAPHYERIFGMLVRMFSNTSLTRFLCVDIAMHGNVL